MTDFTVLVIEDNDSTRKLLRTILEEEGFSVLEAATGREALETMQTEKPNLIIQDFILPDMDGLELNRQLRAHALGADLPILGLSGFLSRMQEVATGTGFTAFLIKPVEPAQLIEVIRTYLPKPTPHATPTSQGKKILIVDVDTAHSKQVGLNLKQVGFKVSFAEDTHSAILQALEQAPDAIVSDIFLPKIDGFQLCLQVRQYPTLNHIPVILFSVHPLEEKDKKLAQEVGANDFVSLAADYQALVNALAQLDEAPEQVSVDASLDMIQAHHTSSLIRQLEREIAINAELEKQSGLQTAQLTLLRSATHALTVHRENIDIVLQNILSSYLDAAGIAKGALYLKNARNIWSLRQFVGYAEEERKNLSKFFGAQQLLTKAMVKKNIIMVPSADVPERMIKRLLAEADITTALIIPLVSVTECLGILFLGSKVTNILEPDPLAFARTLAAQLGQTISLTMTFERLGMSELRYRSLMDSASCGILVLNQEGIILEINKKGEELFGLSKETILDKDYKHFFGSDDVYAVLQLKKLLHDKSLAPQESFIKQANGAQRDVEYSAVCVEIGGENLLLFILNDVTERNRLRTQSLLNDKLSTMGTLAAGIVHEINNPVAWILANLNFLHENIQSLQDRIHNLRHMNQSTDVNLNYLHMSNFTEELKRQFLKFSETIGDSIQGAEQVRDIVHNLKGFARIDDDLGSSRVDVHQVLETAIKIASAEFKYRATLEKDFDTSIPTLVLNKGKLHQVFLNLIMNAVQAMPMDKKAKSVLRIVTRKTAESVCIDISDTGTGISATHLAKIFEPFFTTKSSGMGTGLGLSICHQIITSLGGEIKVHSTLGEGSTFSIVLPLQSHETAVSVLPTLNTQHHATRGRILVIDDEPSLLKTLQRLLENQHNVTLAGSGQAALNLLSQDIQQFDVVITDLNMPEINGMDLYQFMEERLPGSSKRIIFMTAGIVNCPAMSKFMAKVKNTCIEKPFRRDELLQMINKVMQLASV